VDPTLSLAAYLVSAADPTASPLSPLLGQGILGAALALVLAGCRYVIGEIRSSRDREVAAIRAELDRAIRDRDAALDRVASSTTFIQQDVIPLMVRTQDLSRAQLAALHRASPGDL
jgi:hypothetical protein